MLKMKMMAFFKNPVIRNIFIVLLAVVIVAGTISIPISKAGTEIDVEMRCDTMNVYAGNIDVQIPKVGKNESDENKSKYSNVFCIQRGVHINYKRKYQNEFSGYSDEAKAYFKDYGAAMWLVDNMYLADSTNSEIGLDYLVELVTSPDVENAVSQYGTVTAEQIRKLNKVVGNNGYERNFIEVIEQLVLWNYTNNKGDQALDKNVNGGFAGNNIKDEDQVPAKYLYYALKYLSSDKSGYTSNGKVSNVVAFNTANAVIDLENSKVGPYSLKANGVLLNVDSNLKSKISAVVTTIDGSSIELGSDKVVVNEDGTFYLDIANCGQIAKVTLKIAPIYTGCTSTIEVITHDEATDNTPSQNLINIRKEYKSKSFEDNKEIPYAGKYSVKLVKTKNDGSTAITENQATFTISGAVNNENVQTGKENGELQIVSNREITDVAATETYVIEETKAPEGYEAYNGKIQLDVGFKVDGTNFFLDGEKVKLTAFGTNGTVTYRVLEDTIVIYVPNNEVKRETPKFDLALRKYISKVDGKEVEVSRAPIIDAESKLVLENFGTAAYHHTKQAVKVKAGSTVEYTIRVYNEGKVDGVAKEITDYLPEGLTFVKLADDSSALYTTDATEGSKQVVIRYTGTAILNAESVLRNAYQEVKMVCKVNTNASGYLTNRAEITKYGYTDSEGVWHEANADEHADADSVEDTIKSSLGLDTWYENAKTYSYNLDGTTKEVKDYYPGAEDDDDFETVEVEAIEGKFKVIVRKVDLSDKKQGLAGAYFTFDNGTRVGPTDENGYVDLVNETITKEGQKFTYTFKETTAPAGYEKYDKDITLDVTTKLKDAKYVVNKASLKETSDMVSFIVKDNVITITIADEKTPSNFDLSLRKFITNIDGQEITSRIPNVVITDDFKSGKVTTAEYNHPKDPLEVSNASIVTYTIRVYNEGDVDGYVTKIMDDIPDGLEFLPNHSTNKGWKMYKRVVDTYEPYEGAVDVVVYKGVVYTRTDNAKEADLIVNEELQNQMIKAYDAKTMTKFDYKDVKVAFKVTEPNNSKRIITNYAQISEHKDSKGNTTVTDRDSVPNVWNEGEDDQDIENIKLVEKRFDLALRKFITNVNGKEITSRIPEVVLTDDFKSGKVTTAEYNHTKEPVDVVNGNIVTYTIRVYNEGEVDGYATKVMDDIPEGLEFLPEDPTNKNWKMYKRVVDTYEPYEGAVDIVVYGGVTYTRTDNAKEADLIVTEELKDQLIKAYDAKTMDTLDYKDVKVAFKVIEPDTSDRIIINYAQISEHEDSEGNTTVVDIDSTPNVWNEGEDDQDIEKIRLRYFDLALRKWVTEAIVTENGQTQVIKTGHHAEDDPEAIVKVDLKKSKLKDVVVKFRYSIRVTNEGEIPGYAKEVTDYIPAGLKFVAEDNNGWTTTDDPNVVKTDLLSDVLLNPGESAEVTIVLTWINDAKNMGVKINTAEISKDYNKYGAHDIDSTPDNKVPGEDDIDDAPVMLSVKTGSAIIGYVTLAVVCLAIIGLGAHTVKKRIR